MAFYPLVLELLPNLHAGLHFQSNIGVFSSLIAGYSFRGEADNNFDVNGTDDFDVPNAVWLMGKLGYATSKFYVEGWVDYQSSVDRISLNDPAFMGQFPETEVDYTRLGVTVYIPLFQELGASAGYSSVVDGKNIAVANNFSLGITYNLTTNNL